MLAAIEQIELSGESSNTENELVILQGKLRDTEEQLDRVEKQLVQNPDVATLAKVATTLEIKLKTIRSQIEQAKTVEYRDEVESLEEYKRVNQRLSEAKGAELKMLRCKIKAEIQRLVSCITIRILGRRYRKCLVAAIMYSGNGTQFVIIGTTYKGWQVAYPQTPIDFQQTDELLLGGCEEQFVLWKEHVDSYKKPVDGIPY